jgi:hypothetical protein
MKLTDADIKQIYFHCKNTDPQGLYHNNDDELDVLEFGRKIAEYVELRAAQEAKREEHKRCVDLVEKINPVVARYLLAEKEYAE